MPPSYDLKPIQFWATPFYQRYWQEHAAEAPGIIAHLYESEVPRDGPHRQRRRPGGQIGDRVIREQLRPVRRPATRGSLSSSRSSPRRSGRPSPTSTASRVEPGPAPRHFPGQLVSRHQRRWISTTPITTTVARGAASITCRPAIRVAVRIAAPPTAATGSIRRSPPAAVTRISAISTSTSAYVDPPPRDGLLILFPSYLLHSALPYRGERDRIVISFNSCTVPA